MGDNKVDRYIALLAFVIVLCVTLFCQSCSTIKEIPVEVVKERIEYIDRIEYDSIYKRDSIYMIGKNDTFYVYKDKYVYKYQFIHDTTFVSKTDSVPYVVEVEKELSSFQSLQMNVGKICIPIILILICVSVGMLIRKLL